MSTNLFSSGEFSQKKHLHWENDFDLAKESAKRWDRIILLFFQIPDRNISHYDIDRTIFNTTKFIVFAIENLIMLRADFPIKKTILSTDISFQISR